MRMFPFLFLVACSPDESTPADPDVPEADDDDDDDDEVLPGFVLEGDAVDVLSGQTNADLCVTVIDPSQVIYGGDVVLLGEGTTDADGHYRVAGIETDSTLGIFVVVDDCPGDDDVTVASATGIGFGKYGDLGDGEVYTRDALTVTTALYADIDAELADLGWDDTLLDRKGMVLGNIVAPDDAPIHGATTTCSGCPDTFYFDADASDGLFQTGGDINEATDADADALFFIPEAPTTAYVTDGPDHAWEPELFGAMPGMAVFAVFRAVTP